MIAYKEVLIDGDRMFSFSAIGIWKLEYRLNHKTVPNIGKIFVYSRQCVLHDDESALLECEIPDNSQQLLSRCSLSYPIKFTEFWEFNGGFKYIQKDDYPFIPVDHPYVLGADWCLPIRVIG